ncbi:chorismate pyruvate-lyase family protein [Micromonospora sp. HUAS YX12]|uniref:Chorismate pyruvate-lyase family protein n=1 Tax=Micromonospora sp. HUAS YX12 TaxID=3156396 RepID=A0AAU7R3J1_9ACTN
MRAQHAAAPLAERVDLVGMLLLTSDGTLTPMLERVVGERIVTSQLVRTETAADSAEAALLTPVEGDRPVSRTTRLVGASSKRVYLLARSVIQPGLLPPSLRAELSMTDVPIGRLLRRHRVETFRELLSLHVYDDADHRTDIDPEGGHQVAAHRRYRMWTGGSAALLIDEYFTPAGVHDRSPQALDEDGLPSEKEGDPTRC